CFGSGGQYTYSGGGHVTKSCQGDAPDSYTLVGFRETDVRTLNTNGTQLRGAILNFYDNDSLLIGELQRRQDYEPGSSNLFTDTWYYRTRDAAQCPRTGLVTGWACLYRVQEWRYEPFTPSGMMSKQTDYSYDPGFQGEKQYGNLTHIMERTPHDGAVRRTTKRSYAPNTTNWLVGLVFADAI